MLLDATSFKSNILTSRGHLSGWLHAKSFDLDGGIQIKAFSIQPTRHMDLEIEVLNIQGQSVVRLDAKNFDLDYPWMPKSSI